MSKTATSIDASTRGTTRRWIELMPSTSIASSSSRIFRAPRSAQIADPPAPAMIRAVTIGPASRTTASTEAAPVNDCAPRAVAHPTAARRGWTADGQPEGTAEPHGPPGADHIPGRDRHAGDHTHSADGRAHHEPKP